MAGGSQQDVRPLARLASDRNHLEAVLGGFEELSEGETREGCTLFCLHACASLARLRCESGNLQADERGKVGVGEGAGERS